MSNLDVTVPSLGESITEAVIAKWLKKEGEIVNKDEVIAELETDKVTQEIYSPKTGIIKKIFFQEGEEVKIGETIVNIEEKNISEQKIEEKEVKNSNVSGEQNKIIVPALGESISEALISKWMKSAGENVKKGEPIVELETDKVTQELYAESSGVLKEILFNEQEEVKIGETIGVIDLIEAYVPNMVKKGKGRIVIISSIGAITPMPKSSIYASAKSAIYSYGQSLSHELSS